MKRLQIFLILLLLIPLVASQDPTNLSDQNASTDSIKKSFDDLKDKTDTILGTEKQIPESFKFVMKTLFRYGDTITISQAIISIMLLVFFTLLFIDIMQTFSIFSENTNKLTGVILTLIISMIGTIKSLTNFLLNVGGFFGLIENWSVGVLTVVAIILLSAIILLNKLKKKIVKAKGLSKAFERGAKVGADIAYVEAQRKIQEKMD